MSDKCTGVRRRTVLIAWNGVQNGIGPVHFSLPIQVDLQLLAVHLGGICAGVRGVDLVAVQLQAYPLCAGGLILDQAPWV